jgi:hypothetical protein
VCALFCVIAKEYCNLLTHSPWDKSTGLRGTLFGQQVADHFLVSNPALLRRVTTTSSWLSYIVISISASDPFSDFETSSRALPKSR